MSNYYGINRSDEYLQHWGIPKGGQRKNHKYLMRVKSGSGWRYLYTPAEVAAYGKEKITTGAKTAFRKLTAKANNTLFSRAAYGVKRVAGLFRDANANQLPSNRHQASRPASGRNLGRLGTEAVQSHLKKSRPDRYGKSSHTAETFTDAQGRTSYRSNMTNPQQTKYAKHDKRNSGDRAYGTNPNTGKMGRTTSKEKHSKTTGIVGATASKIGGKVLKAVGAKNSKSTLGKAVAKRYKYGTSHEKAVDNKQSNGYFRSNTYGKAETSYGGRTIPSVSGKAGGGANTGTSRPQWRDRITMPNGYEWTGKK